MSFIKDHGLVGIAPMPTLEDLGFEIKVPSPKIGKGGSLSTLLDTIRPAGVGKDSLIAEMLRSEDFKEYSRDLMREEIARSKLIERLLVVLQVIKIRNDQAAPMGFLGMLVSL